MGDRVRRLRLRIFSVWLIGSFLFCIGLPPSFQALASRAPAANAVQAVQQGIAAYEKGQYGNAQRLWETALGKLDTPSDRLIVLENLARVSNQLGQFTQAAGYWQTAIALTQTQTHLPDQQTLLGRLLIEQAQTYGQLGQHRRAITLLCGRSDVLAARCESDSAIAIAHQTHNAWQRVAALGLLGEQHRLLGQYPLAEDYLLSAQALLENRSLEPRSDVQPQSANPSTTESAQLQDSDESWSHFQLALFQGLGSLYETLAKRQYRRAEAAQEMGDQIVAQDLRQAAIAQERQAQAQLEQGLRQTQQLSALSSKRSTAAIQHQELRFWLQLIPLYARQAEDSQGPQTSQRPQKQIQSATIRPAQKAALRLLDELPDSQAKAFSAIELARLVSQSGHSSAPQPVCQASPSASLTQSLLQQGLAIAERIGDRRATSFAQGELGHLAECQGQYRQAIALTQAARQAAQQSPLGQDSLYLWDWQLGRIFEAQGESQKAAIAYQSAIATLNEIRSDILTADPELQFDFRDTIEPIYRGLAALELEDIPASRVLNPAEAQSQASGQALRNTLQTLDSLKLSELQNYFGSDCVIAPTTTAVIDLNRQQSGTALISTIILQNRTAVIASFPDGSTQVEWIEQGRDRLRETVNQFRRGLEAFFRPFDPTLAQQLYDGLIRPFEPQLQEQQVQTLVFVHDGVLRSVPMAALHDGQQFLVERFAIATTPSLELTDPKGLRPERLRALALGLSNAVTVDATRFEPLPFVKDEVASVTEQLEGSQTLLNQNFNRDRLQQVFAQRRYPIIHVATHGQFGAEPDSNFIVMGNGQKLTIGALERLIRQLGPNPNLNRDPIELLALTACETAIGDERATLGLAGVAIRAGARSAVASLWSIHDAVTAELVKRFYQGLLDPQLNKAEALQQAQIALIEQGGSKAHPARWAPLILIGNWL